jgi:hypothetical protein
LEFDENDSFGVRRLKWDPAHCTRIYAFALLAAVFATAAKPTANPDRRTANLNKSDRILQQLK